MDFSVEDVQKFKDLGDAQRDIIEIATMRIKTRIESLDKAQKDYIYARDNYLDALVSFSDDDDDDFGRAFEKDQKLALYETQFENMGARLNFERRESERLSAA